MVHTSVSSMDEILKSPYEANESAEVGEQLFEYAQKLIDPGIGLSVGNQEPEKGPSGEAIEVFGEDRAETILVTYRQIAYSGILYGYGWTDGVIQGHQCGSLEKELLLLCLYVPRIARSDAYKLKHAIKDLEVWDIVSGALASWKLKKKYPSLARCDNIQLFKKKQTQCFKCILFLARAVTCMKYMEWNFQAISDDKPLKTKIYACLDILENFVTVNQKPKVQKKKKVQKAAPTLPQKRERSRTNRRDKPRIATAADIRDKLRNAMIGPQAIALDFMTYHDENNTKTHGHDLSRRLRSKDCKIIGICVHPDDKFPPSMLPMDDEAETKPKETRRQTSDIAQEHTISRIPSVSGSARNDGLKELSNFDNHPSRSLSKNDKKGKKQKQPVSHALFDVATNPKQRKNGTISNSASPRNGFTHTLFDSKNKSGNQSDERNFVDVPRNFAIATNNNLPAYVSDGSMQSASSDPNFWYPVDPEELLLNPMQIETAWLVEESMYCNRSSNIDWIYVMQYASPPLQIELRMISGATNDEETLAKMLYNGNEAKRFAILRREIKRKLVVKKVVRTRMQGILPRLRMATHPLRLKRMELKKNATQKPPPAAAKPPPSSPMEDLVF